MIDQIRKVVEKEKNIQIAYLYGSFAKGTQRKGSDIDIGVVLKNPKLGEKDPYLESKLALKIEKALRNGNVEVRVLNNTSLRFLNQVLSYGKLVYSRNRKFTINFEMMARDNYFDFLPFLRYYDKLRGKRMGL